MEQAPSPEIAAEQARQALERALGEVRTDADAETLVQKLLARAAFSNGELAITLLSPCLPYSLRAVRVGAQMLGSRGNRPKQQALLARQERAESVVRHIATDGQQTEPRESFW